MKRRTIGILLALLSVPLVLRAQEIKPPEFVGIRVGFADRYKAGLWTPIELTLRGGSQPMTGRVRATVCDNDGVPCQTEMPETSCQVLPGQDLTVMLYARFGQSNEGVRAEFAVGSAIVAAKDFHHAYASSELDEKHFLDPLSERGLIVHVGRSSAGAEDAVALSKFEGKPQTAVARLTDVAGLPTRWYGYEGVDAVLLSTGQPEIYRKLTAENVRIEALDQWVHMGGKLVLCVGAQADQVLAPGQPLARFAPGKLENMVTLHQTGEWETYCKGANPVPALKTGDKSGWLVPRLTDVQGKIELREADLPLVIRTPRGLGQVIFVAADLDRPPLRLWSDRKLLAAKLLDLPTESPPAKDSNAGPNYGYTDLAGHLRSSLDQFTGVRLVPFYVVALLVLGYILLIGPGDYFFLRRVVRRMEWTWITFPTIVVLVTGGAYVMAYRLKGNQLRINQVDLLDVDTDGSVRGTTWFNVFSPRMETFNLSFEPRLPDGHSATDPRTTLAWLGIPRAEHDQRGQSGPSLWNPNHYGISPSLDAIRGAPIQVWSTKSFTSRWSAKTATTFIQAKLTEEGRELSGTIVSKLDFSLTNCFLVYGPAAYGSTSYTPMAYTLNTIEPGRPVEIGSASRIRLDTLMAGRRSTFEGNAPPRSDGNPYDQSNQNAAYVLQAMMFFDAAGGRQSTGLPNDYQRFVDLSGLLQAGQAVLVAFPPAAGDHRGGQILRDGQPIGSEDDRRTVVYRFVFPVSSKQ